MADDDEANASLIVRCRFCFCFGLGPDGAWKYVRLVSFTPRAPVT